MKVDAEAGPEGGMEALVCMKDDAVIDGDDPRCRHPSSTCRFRESCRVVVHRKEAARAMEKRGETGRTGVPDGE